MHTKNERKVEIYNRILHYCPFSLSYKREKGMDITKHLSGNAKIRITCFESINFKDADVLFAIVYLISIAEQNQSVNVLITSVAGISYSAPNEG